MKHLFIVNPAAGKTDRTGTVNAAVASAFVGRSDEYEVVVSRAPGHCTKLARAACETGEELRIYACGGDGTLNEIVNGVMGFPNAAISCYPQGTGNDFIKVFSDPDAFRQLPLLLDGEESEFDVIAVNGDRYAINICSMGFDARIGTQVADYKRLPMVKGKSAYLLSALVNTVRGITGPYTITLDDGQILDGRKTLVCIANGRWYGGCFNPVPEAMPDDGLLDVLIVELVTRMTVAAAIGRYQHGQYAQYPNLIRHHQCRSLRIQCPEPEGVNLDGELLFSKDVTFSVADQKIRFVHPRDMVW